MTKKTVALCLLLFACCYSSLAQSAMIQSENNTSCGVPNGAIHVTIAGGEVIDYSFEWRKNGQILNPVTILGYAVGSNTVSLINLSSGSYGVTITNNSNPSMMFILEVSVEDAVILPEVITETIPNTSCSVNYNGSATATVTGNASDYSFTWYQGEGTGGSIIGNTSTLTQLASGYYTVKVTNLETSCASVLGASVSDQPVSVEATVNTTANTNCASSPNGSLATSTSGPAVQYTFSWYAGVNASGDVLSSAATLDNVAGGNYTVKIIDIDTGCSAAVTGEVANDCPQGIFIQTTNNTSCAAPNGSLSASVSGQTSGYTFEWYTGSNTQDPAFVTGSVVTNLTAGNYTVRVVDNSNSSEVGILSTTIQDAPVMPSVAIEVTPNTSCLAMPNGSLSATVINGLAEDHSFKWYLNGSVFGNGPTIIQVPGGMYTVQVTNMITSCTTMGNVTLPDDLAIPDVTVDTVNNTTCDSTPNGSLTASTEGPAAQYTFEWYAGTEALGDILSTTETLSNVAGAEYTVRVTDLNSGCFAQVTKELVDDCRNIMVEGVSNTSCGAPNGSAAASVNGSTSGYTFQWYANLTASGDVISTGAIATGLSAGNYSVRVTKQSNSFEVGVAQVMVADATVLPIVTLESTSNTSCTVPNGSLTATTTNGLPEEHDFAWYNGDTDEGTVLGTGSTLTGIAGGTYTVKVTNLNSCASVVSASVYEALEYPVVTVATTSNTDCFSPQPNGSLTATTTPESQYTYEWYAGVNTSGEPLSNSATMSDVAGGTYTVEVVNAFSGCSATVSAQVPDNCDLVTGNESKNQKDSNRSVSYYPNPATTRLNIVSKVNTTLSLIDVHGTTIFRQNISASADPFAIDLSGVKPGIYVLRVRDAKRTTHHQVVVK